jgi:hypothetical protein
VIRGWPLSKAYYEVGELTRQLDAFAEAPEVFWCAVALFESLSRESPADPEPRRALALVLRLLGTLEGGAGHDDQALPLIGRSRDLLRTVSEAAHDDVELRIEWAETELYWASALASSNRPPSERLEATERALSILDARIGAKAPSSASLFSNMDAYSSQTSALADAGRPLEVLTAFTWAHECGEALYRTDPTEPNVGHELARTFGNIGLSLDGIGRRDEGLAV